MAYYTGYGFYSVLYLSFVTFVFGSGGVLFLVEPAITNYGDGLWYAFVTSTTVGYGDLLAVTLIGRITSVFLTIYGLIFFGCLSAVIINYYTDLNKERGEDKSTANYSTREYREKLYDDLHVRLRDTAILMCAIFIASIGLNMNSTAVIIGAMLISPLMTPIVGLGFGLAIFDTRLIKQSLEVLLTQVLVSLLVSTLYFWISPLSYASSELIARTSPTIWDVLIAIAGGIAGVIGSRKKEANNIVPGVAIATALMPPICTAGYGLANGNVRFLLGALYLFLINCVFIMLANIVGTRILMRKSPLTSFKELSIKMRIGLISLIVLLILPASYSAVTLTIEQARKEGIKQFVGKEFANYTVINQVYKSSNNELVLTVVGDPISEEELETLHQKQASYGIQSVQLKVNQVQNSPTLDSEATKEFYENIDKYIDQKLSEKDSQNDLVKENEADKD